MLSEKDKKILSQCVECRFTEKIFEYIEYMRAKECVWGKEKIYVLKKINNAIAESNEDDFTKEMAIEVCKKLSREDGLIDKNYFSLLRGFSLFLYAFDSSCFVVPIRFWATIPSVRRTYIFTPEELEKTISWIDEYCNSKAYFKRIYGEACPYPVIFRILAGTGMRIGEVLSLKLENVDLDNGIIRVLDGKGHISRLVPVSSSLKNVIVNYCEKMQLVRGCDFLFPSPYKPSTHRQNYTVNRLLNKIIKKMELPLKCGEKPVVHTFRHTFCTNALNKLLADGMDADNAVRLVATYVGHTSVNVTYDYLHMTERAINDFNDKQAALFDQIPEVDEEDNYEW